MSHRAHMIERLEDRTMMFVSPVQPYPVSNTVLKAQFTSAIPKIIVGGSPIPVTLKIINSSNEPQQGRIDLTFCLDDAKNTRIISRASDPKILVRPVGSTAAGAETMTNLLLDLKPHGYQIFKFDGTIPTVTTSTSFYFVASIDPGGYVAIGGGYQSSVLGSNLSTFVMPPFTDVNIGTYSINVNKKTGIGTFSGTVKNYKQNANIASTGSVQFSLFAGLSPTTSDATLLTPVIAGSNVLDIGSLGPGKSKKITFKFTVPTTLTGQYFLGVSLDRSAVTFTIDDPSESTTFFSRKTITLG